jgi:hypothetical protein
MQRAMTADRSRSGLASVAAVCSVVAAAAFGVLPALSALSSNVSLSHPWLFALGAVAFITNLKSGLHPAVRALAAVGQALCVFEALGFSLGVTFMAYAGPAGWQMVEWWLWPATWGLFCVGLGALVFSVLGRRAG